MFAGVLAPRARSPYPRQAPWQSAQHIVGEPTTGIGTQSRTDGWDGVPLPTKRANETQPARQKHGTNSNSNGQIARNKIKTDEYEPRPAFTMYGHCPYIYAHAHELIHRKCRQDASFCSSRKTNTNRPPDTVTAFPPFRYLSSKVLLLFNLAPPPNKKHVQNKTCKHSPDREHRTQERNTQARITGPTQAAGVTCKMLGVGRPTPIHRRGGSPV